MNSLLREIESLVGKNIRRDISRMVDFSAGQLGKAAQSIVDAPRAHVGIVVGFFIRHANPPSPETDGLNGMAHLAAGFANAGHKVTIITDTPCAKAVWAVVDSLPHRVSLEVVDVDEAAVRRLRDHLSGNDPLTHLIAIERVSPGTDGRPHREHGWDMSRETAPLHLLFEERGWNRPWLTIGIGDGGNEIGMGNLPKEIVNRDIPNGALIAATTSSDFLIVAAVSNWGAYGLLCAVALLKPTQANLLLQYFTAPKEVEFLEAAVNVGQAIDDSRVDRPGTLQMSVDRLPVQEHADMVNRIRSLVVAT